MRIAYLSVSDQLGGSEIALLEMIKGVRRLRPSWPLHLVLPGRGPLLERAEAAGADCTVLPLPGSLARVGESAAEDARWSIVTRAALAGRLAGVALSMPSYVGRMRRLLRSIDPAIVHSNGLKAHIVGSRAAGRARVIWHIHDYVGPRRVTRSLLRAHVQRPSAIVVNSSSVAADVTSAILPSVPVAVVYNAVDLSEFAPDGAVWDLDAAAGLAPAPAGTIRVGLVATFARWKGHEVFLQALSRLPSNAPVRGYVIGAPLYDTSGSQYTMEELEASVRQLRVENRVGFTGFLPAASAMRALDVVVHASTRPEPFGLVIAEAMACGRAVITSATGGSAELVEPEVDALTHAPGDPASLADRLTRLISDASLRRRLGHGARVAACRRFDPDRLANDLVAVYEQGVQ
jgi:glycosyltransferase involved in cell wall biosynthesis